jgi:signal peptidase I
MVEAFKIPSGTMRPTLMVGDHLLVAKTEASLGSIQRGDVIVFPYPENPKKNFLKRVVGTGGDKVQYINGELFLNDQAVVSKLIGTSDDAAPPQLEGYGPPVVYEEQVGNRSYRVQYLRDKAKLNDGPWLVPQDAVFVLGDNRDNSQDSRHWGAVPRNTIIGKAMKLYWSWDRDSITVRWKRIGETIR